MDVFNVNINCDNVLDIFNNELFSIKVKVIKECIKFLINEDILNPDEFDKMEKGLLAKLKKN